MRAHRLVLAFVLTVAAYGQDEDPLFAGAERFSAGSSGSSEVSLDKDALGLAGAAAGGMESVYVRTYEYPRPGMYKLADLDDFRKRMDAAECKHIARVREKDEYTDVCARVDKDGHWRELIVISAEPTELSFVHLKGAVSLSDLSRLGALGQAAAAKPAAKQDPKLEHR